MPALLERLGCQVSIINLEPDGRFPRPPSRSQRTLASSRRWSQRCRRGFAVDPDVDRLAIVDERGHAIGEDYTLALAARVVLPRRPGTS
jgi:phosphomannomutase